MKANVPAGKYVLAVSGGVDSMVLLDLLSNVEGLDLVVAHFNHGMRADSSLDEELVAKAAHQYGYAFESGQGKLGPNASEADARKARYDFLESVKKKHQADKIITAHHQDDAIETAFLNLMRGSGARGLVAIKSNSDVLRPMLGYSKRQIIEYALGNNLAWNEDATNADLKHSRNYLRHKVLPKLNETERTRLLGDMDKLEKNQAALDVALSSLEELVLRDGLIDRAAFISLPTDLGSELVLYWLRQKGFRQYERKNIEKVVLAIKTAQPNTTHRILKDLNLIVAKTTASLERT